MEAFGMAMAGPPHDAFFRRIRDMRTEAHKRADAEILGRLTNENELKTLTEAETQLDLMQVRTERVRRMMGRLQAEMRAKYDEAPTIAWLRPSHSWRSPGRAALDEEDSRAEESSKVRKGEARNVPVSPKMVLMVPARAAAVVMTDAPRPVRFAGEHDCRRVPHG